MVLARVDLRQVHTRLHIARQVGNGASIPERGKIRVRDGHELSPQHAELKADPRQRERRNVVVRVKRLPIDGVRLGEALEIGKHGAERHQIFEPTARRGDSATRSEHRIELHATCLIDRQRVALDRLARSAHQRGAREVASCIVEAMHCRSDLGVNERCARRVVHACELRGERFQTVECVQIAEKLRGQTLVVDNRLGNARAARVLRETCPCATARALQVDRGDLPVGRGRTGDGQVPRSSLMPATPKRVFRLPRPVLSNVDTMVLTTMSG